MDQMVAQASPDPFGARATLTTAQGTTVVYYRLRKLVEDGLVDLDRLPFTVRILLENLLRNAGGEYVKTDDVEALAKWRPARSKSAAAAERELPFLPGRVVLQDFTGVPAVVDLAAMRAAGFPTVERSAFGAGRVQPSPDSPRRQAETLYAEAVK